MICSVGGCQKEVLARRMCGAHYQRWSKHGDPLFCAKPLSERGSIPAWLLAHLNYQGASCLIWPFARRKSDGRAKMTLNGRSANPSRVMCDLVHGPAPTPKHQTAHSCGKSHLGCTHPKHLRWATHAENEEDKLLHGTTAKGEMLPQTKLKENDIRIIRSMRHKKLQRDLAEEFGVSDSHICAIQLGHKWKHVDAKN